MGWFTRRGRDDVADELGLDDAWRTLAPELGGAVEVRSARSVHVVGRRRGRTFEADVDADGLGPTDVLRMAFGETKRKRQAYRQWRTSLSVSCAAAAERRGTLRSYVDVRDPAWNPRVYDPNAGRAILTDPPTLAAHVLTPAIRAKLLEIAVDVDITIHPDAVRIEHHTKVPQESGFLAGSVIHAYPGPVQRMPASAVAGPPWWIDLLCDIAELAEAR